MKKSEIRENLKDLHPCTACIPNITGVTFPQTFTMTWPWTDSGTIIIEKQWVDHRDDKSSVYKSGISLRHQTNLDRVQKKKEHSCINLNTKQCKLNLNIRHIFRKWWRN